MRWFNVFTNLFLLVALGCIVLFGLLVAKCYVNFWVFDMVFPGKETFERYFLTVVNMFAMLFCLFAIRQAISLKGSVWNARTGGEALVEVVYMLSMLAPVLAFGLTVLLPVGFMVFGIFQSGLNRIEWVHTHDVKDKYGQTIGRGFTARPNVGKSHRPDRIDLF